MSPIFNYKGFNVTSGLGLKTNDFISVESKSGTINLSCLNNPRIGIFNIKVVGFLPNGVDSTS
jgi:hypothetical protein